MNCAESVINLFRKHLGVTGVFFVYNKEKKMNEQFNKLKIALPKGRLEKNAYYTLKNMTRLASYSFENRGRDCEDILSFLASYDKFIYKQCPDRIYRIKPTDIPSYVDSGEIDLGICGWDSIFEYEMSNVTNTGAMLGRGYDSSIVEDLELKKTVFRIAGFSGKEGEYFDKLKKCKPIVVGTSYPSVTKKFFSSRNPNAIIDIMKLSGSCEIAPMLGADVIFDIVETGRTIEENGLVIYGDENYKIDNSTKLLVSKNSLRKSEKLTEIVSDIKKILSLTKQENSSILV